MAEPLLICVIPDDHPLRFRLQPFIPVMIKVDGTAVKVIKNRYGDDTDACQRVLTLAAAIASSATADTLAHELLTLPEKDRELALVMAGECGTDLPARIKARLAELVDTTPTQGPEHCDAGIPRRDPDANVASRSDPDGSLLPPLLFTPYQPKPGLLPSLYDGVREAVRIAGAYPAGRFSLQYGPDLLLEHILDVRGTSLEFLQVGDYITRLQGRPQVLWGLSQAYFKATYEPTRGT